MKSDVFEVKKPQCIVQQERLCGGGEVPQLATGSLFTVYCSIRSRRLLFVEAKTTS